MDHIDLKPIGPETIDEMGITDHDLWMIKVDDSIYGPFETESLKHYASENENTFAKAHATRLDVEDWKDFYSFSHFHRKTQPQAAKSAAPGPFWIMENGLKSLPMTLSNVEKKVQDGDLVVTEIVSTDDGHTWHKLYEIPPFDHKHGRGELPKLPQESNFQAAIHELEEKRERRAHGTVAKEDLAEAAHQALQTEKSLSFDIKDTIEAAPVSVLSVPSQGFPKWIIPAAMSLVVTIASGAYFFTGDKDLPEVTGQTISGKPEESHQANPSAHLDMPQRLPTSYNPPPMPQSHNYNNQPISSQYPSYTETHQSPPEEHMPDPMLEPVAEDANYNPPPPLEHSLVQNGQPPEDLEPPADAAMNQQPMVEESSDF